MLILLPPSEGKADRGTGRPLNLAGLSLPELTDARATVLDALVDFCVRDEHGALAGLGLSAGQVDDVRRNGALRTIKTLPAARLYTGVLYDALDLGSLSSAQYTWLKRSVVIFSGLWGAVRLGDRIPPYRCPMGARLPGLPGSGGLAAFWKPVLDGPLTRLPAAGSCSTCARRPTRRRGHRAGRWRGARWPSASCMNGSCTGSRSAA